jgi:hypothetical protein
MFVPFAVFDDDDNHQNVTDECLYRGALNDHLWEYMNRRWAATDRNLYSVVCAYDEQPNVPSGSKLEKIRYYTIHLLGNNSYVTIPCYNDNFCSDAVLPGLLVYDKDEELSDNATPTPIPIHPIQAR